MKETTTMYWYGSGIGGWGYALTAIGMVLFWGAVIYGIVALVRYARRAGCRRKRPGRRATARHQADPGTRLPRHGDAYAGGAPPAVRKIH
jgi:hypothetical protein